MTTEPRQGERLQKVLARAGFGSRRKSEGLITAGRVFVNGKRAELGSRVQPDDTVVVDGVTVDLAPDRVYLALNKPAGVLSSVKDARGREVVVDLVPSESRVFPVGRLDRDTSGLILLTNDGEFANRVSHPRYEVTKTYIAEVRGLPRGALSALRRGVRLEDGMARAEEVRVKAVGTGRTLVELTVREGRNRLVRRMLDAAGGDVLSLARTAIGSVRIGRLKPGTYRKLRREEIQELLGASSEDAP